MRRPAAIGAPRFSQGFARCVGVERFVEHGIAQLRELPRYRRSNSRTSADPHPQSAATAAAPVNAAQRQPSSGGSPCGRRRRTEIFAKQSAITARDSVVERRSDQAGTRRARSSPHRRRRRSRHRNGEVDRSKPLKIVRDDRKVDMRIDGHIAMTWKVLRRRRDRTGADLTDGSSGKRRRRAVRRTGGLIPVSGLLFVDDRCEIEIDPERGSSLPTSA